MPHIRSAEAQETLKNRRIKFVRIGDALFVGPYWRYHEDILQEMRDKGIRGSIQDAGEILFRNQGIIAVNGRSAGLIDVRYTQERREYTGELVQAIYPEATVQSEL